METLQAILRKPRTIPIPRWITPRHYTITLAECFGHASFILVFLSYAVDDFLVLRIVAVAGSTSMLFFTYFHPHGRVLWLPFQWNLAFIAMNSYRIGRVYWDRYSAQRLPAELLELHDQNFYLMSPEDYARLMRIATLQEYNTGDVVVQQGEMNRHVRIVLSGTLKVLRDGQLTYILERANFISEAGLHTGLMLPGRVESCCTVVADSPVRLLNMDRTELMELLRRHTGLRRALKATLSWDIVRKLKKQRVLLTEHIIEDADAWTRRRHEQTFHRYAAILHNMLSHPKYLAERRKELNKYRMIHHIDDEHHNAALRQVGWTPEEFEAGHKQDGSTMNSQHGLATTTTTLEEDDDDASDHWIGRFRDFCLRLLG
jgi:CRP-like cAMP-binding protein